MLLRTECKCHGVSGSCAMRTCWKNLPSFHTVGNIMMRKYRKAKMVQAIPAVGKDNGSLQLVLKRCVPPNDTFRIKIDNMTCFVYFFRRGKQQHTGVNSQKPKRMEMIYLHPSPNYCERDMSTGILGTIGRQCNRSSTSMDKCDLLCCGRGYNTHNIVKSWQCNCKFKWCCTVSCDICTERIEEYTCK